MKKSKAVIAYGIFASSVFLLTGLTGCITTMPMGMPGMMPGGMGGVPAMGGQQSLGQRQGASPQSSGTNWAGKGLFGTGGIMGISAEKFATNVHSLEIGKSTPEDVIILLGTPMARHKDGHIDFLNYTLFSNGAYQGGANFTFVGNKLQHIEANKQIIGAGMSSEKIFEKGEKPKFQ